VRCYVGVGSNLGSRLENLERAAVALKEHHRLLKVSPVYQNPALVPKGAPAEWNLAFLNAVFEVETETSASDFFHDLKKIEAQLGRAKAERWAPRIVDLDLLLWGDEEFQTEELTVPHVGLWDRSFVLDPLKDLAPNLKPPGKNKTVLQRSREVTGHSPLWMGILNLTPDSFSDGGKWMEPSQFLAKAQEMTRAGVQVLDVGAESTRPGATALSANEEWERLKLPLSQLIEQNRNLLFRPRISVDTRHAEVAERALALGADWINDVSGLSSLAMVELAAATKAPWIFMHSLTIPVDKTVTLPVDQDPVKLLKEFAWSRLEFFEARGISSDRLMFDPGIGFGKTETQSLEILKRVSEFHELPFPLLIGHSRKSFMRLWTGEKPMNRDGDSVGISLRLIESKVDILRVHEPALHIGAHLAWSHL
jgi:2-amino-4-hydroxy-6-hydroxymethyldihydropteridine diphosphokinase/dihydropteroate synthase